MAARTIGRARSTAAAHCDEDADALTDGTPGACANSGASTVIEWMKNAANAAISAPSATALRAAQVWSPLRAPLTP
jgi:hypothetical protein